MLEYEAIHSIHRSSKNERLNNAKTHTPLATLSILFILERRKEQTSQLQQNVRTYFRIPSDISHSSEVGRYKEVKCRMYLGELQIEFYLKLMRMFCREGENFIIIHCGSKCLLAGAIRFCSRVLQ